MNYQVELVVKIAGVLVLGTMLVISYRIFHWAAADTYKWWDIAARARWTRVKK